MKDAFIKNYAALTDRRRQRLGGFTDSSLISVEGEHWKMNRKMLSPEFSSGKLKKVQSLLVWAQSFVVWSFGTTNSLHVCDLVIHY